MPYPCCGPHCSVCRMSMSSVPCSSSIRFLYWSFSFIDVDTLLSLEVDRLLRFVQRSDQPCPLSRFKSTSVLRTKIGDSALVINRQCTHRGKISNCKSAWGSDPNHARVTGNQTDEAS